MTSTAQIKIEIKSDPSGARRVKRDLDEVGKAGGQANRAVASLKSALISLASGLSVGLVVNELRKFSDAVAEVSTLVDTATFDMRTLNDAALDMSAAFGSAPQQQAKAYYQIISAGAKTAAEATDTLTVANKLAVGGVTDVFTAADGLTTIMNAYRKQAVTAQEASDGLFVAMRAGKTTIGEMSEAIGRVAPLAAQAGVSFDETSAAIAALTKGGINTRESVTGLRAILAAVVKPTKEAKDMAAALGLEFSAAALESKGLAGFLQDLADKTGGSTEVLTQLFGGVEAAVPIMSFAGQAGADFTDIMVDMGKKAGATEDAVDKMMETIGKQMDRVLGSAQAELVKTTASFGGVLVPGLKAVADNMGSIFRGVEMAASTLVAVMVARMTPAITASAASFTFATSQAFAYQAALARMAGFSGAAARAMAGLNVVMGTTARMFALLGGPLGVALIGTLGLIALRANKVGEATEVLNDNMERLINKAQEYTGADVKTKNIIRDDISQAIKELQSEREKLVWAQEQLSSQWLSGVKNLGSSLGLGDVSEKSVGALIRQVDSSIRTLESMQNQFGQQDNIVNDLKDLKLDFGLEEQSNALKDIKGEIANIVDATRTPAEELRATLDHIASLRPYAKTAEEIEALRRATVEAFEAQDDLNKGLTRGDLALESFAQGAAQTFADFITGTTDARSALRGLVNDIAAAVMQQTVTNPLGNLLSGAISGVMGGIGGPGNGAARAAARGVVNPALFGPGFATGGSIMVGGYSGVDRNQLSLNGAPIARVSHGERIDIVPPGRSTGGVTIHQNINYSPGVADAARAEMVAMLPMLREDTRRAVQEAQLRGRA
jgi:TP901 family phage tail tape measure protein